MTRIFPALWQSIKDVYGELFPYVGMNLIWLLLTVPMLMVLWFVSVVVSGGAALGEDINQLVGVLLILFAVIGPSPASVGIHTYANRLVKEERVEFSLFWEGLRTYWRPALILFLISFVAFALLAINIAFYMRSELPPIVSLGLSILWFYASFIWLMMQGYLLPLLVEQDDKRITLVVRNAFYLTIANPIFTIILMIATLVVVVLSAVVTLLFALVVGSLVTTMAHRATLTLLDQYRPPAAP